MFPGEVKDWSSVAAKGVNDAVALLCGWPARGGQGLELGFEGLEEAVHLSLAPKLVVARKQSATDRRRSGVTMPPQVDVVVDEPRYQRIGSGCRQRERRESTKAHTKENVDAWL